MIEQWHGVRTLKSVLLAQNSIDPPRLTLDELNLKKRIGRNSLEPNVPLDVNQERTVQRLVLKVVVRPIAFEQLELGVGEDRHGELNAVFVVFERLGGVHIVGADGDRLDIQLLQRLVFLAECLKLLHAMGTFPAQEEDNEHILAFMTGQVPSGVCCVGLRERIGGDRAPYQRAERLQVDPVNSGFLSAGRVCWFRC